MAILARAPAPPWRLYHYSMVGVVRCGNQKEIGTFDSLLLYGVALRDSQTEVNGGSGGQ